MRPQLQAAQGADVRGRDRRATSDSPAAAPWGERQGRASRGASVLGRLLTTVLPFSGARRSLGAALRPVLRGWGFPWVRVTLRARGALGVQPREN